MLEKGKMFKCALVEYYAPQYKTVVEQSYRDLYAGIENYNKEYFKTHQEYPDYSSEDEYHISILIQNLLPQIRNRKAIEERLKDINSKKKLLLEQAKDLNVQKAQVMADNSLKLGRMTYSIFWTLEIISLAITIVYLVLIT